MEFQARLYASQSSAQQSVWVRVAENGQVFVDNDPVAFFASLEVSERMGNTPRYLRLPDGRSLETRDNDSVDQLCQQWGKNREGLLHKLESNLKLAAISAVVLLFGGYLFIAYGIPALSRPIAHMMPHALEDQLAESALAQLDGAFFQPTELSETRQQSLRQQFNELLPDSGRNYRLLFRHSERLGPNAFALPDGTIIFTDQLIALADEDAMIAPIMLHEIGHVEERHSMQSLVQQAGLSAVILLVSGDVNSASSLVLLLPTVLIQAGYSQQKELEADTYALEQSRARDINLHHFADMMERMMASHDEVLDTEEQDERRQSSDEQSSDSHASQTESSTEKEHGDEGRSLIDYFSTHPPSRERITRFREAADAAGE